MKVRQFIVSGVAGMVVLCGGAAMAASDPTALGPGSVHETGMLRLLPGKLGDVIVIEPDKAVMKTGNVTINQVVFTVPYHYRHVVEATGDLRLPASFKKQAETKPVLFKGDLGFQSLSAVKPGETDAPHRNFCFFDHKGEDRHYVYQGFVACYAETALPDGSVKLENTGSSGMMPVRFTLPALGSGETTAPAETPGLTIDHDFKLSLMFTDMDKHRLFYRWMSEGWRIKTIDEPDSYVDVDKGVARIPCHNGVMQVTIFDFETLKIEYIPNASGG